MEITVKASTEGKTIDVNTECPEKLSLDEGMGIWLNLMLNVTRSSVNAMKDSIEQLPALESTKRECLRLLQKELKGILSGVWVPTEEEKRELASSFDKKWIAGIRTMLESDEELDNGQD